MDENKPTIGRSGSVEGTESSEGPQSKDSRLDNSKVQINSGFTLDDTDNDSIENYELKSMRSIDMGDPVNYGVYYNSIQDVEHKEKLNSDTLIALNGSKLSYGSTAVSIPDENNTTENNVTFGPSSCTENLQEKLTKFSEKYHAFVKKHKSQIKLIIIIILALLYAAYFIYAMTYRFGDEGSIRLLWMTCAVVLGVAYMLLKQFLQKRNSLSKYDEILEKIRPYGPLINWVVICIIAIIVIVFVIVDVVQISKQPYNLVSATGIVIYILLLFVFSKHPLQVNWLTVCWGLCLQFIFAMIILRTQVGLDVFEWLGDRVSTFFTYADYGSEFVFGAAYTDHYFAFKVLPVIIYFGAIVSVLYHIGVMQLVISKIAWIMYITMGTTAGESMTAAANIFLGQTEAPLLIKPFLNDMTAAELHSIMVSGFSTVSGGILAAYIYLGVSARHLISASVMSAPAALAMSKLSFPETEKSKNTVDAIENCEAENEGNLIEALSNGAAATVKMVAGIACNLIAFIATLYFVNGVLTWFGNRVGIELLTFQMICSYVLWPLALVMGVEVSDCRRVAQLIGIKTFLNEFIAYESLGVFISNKKLFDVHVTNNGSWYSSGDDIILLNSMTSLQATTGASNETLLSGGFISDRSTTIATYALCGFSNFGSMGIMLGGLSSLAPERRSVLATLVLRAMIAGTVACFITACIAGLFYTED